MEKEIEVITFKAKKDLKQALKIASAKDGFDNVTEKILDVLSKDKSISEEYEILKSKKHIVGERE